VVGRGLTGQLRDRLRADRSFQGASVVGGGCYTYRLEGSVDGTHWYTLGGRGGPAPATDAGDTTNTEATARYVRVVGFGNTANGTFHLTEVSVYGTPVS
jgi:hypothetical protein